MTLRNSLENLQKLVKLGPLYHDFSVLGINNIQRKGIFKPNQQAKAPIITAYISWAIAKCKQEITDEVSLTELFCSDCYYSMIASRLGCSRCIGIGRDKVGFEVANVISKILNINSIEFKRTEITPHSVFESTDIVMNTGGLYHVSDPESILKLSYFMAKKYLIVQGLVSLATEDEDYLEVPAPGSTWGNRMSRQSFDKMIRKVCPNIIDSHFNYLTGNPNPPSRGSSYYLIKK